MRRQARWLPALRLPALMLGGSLCAFSHIALAEEAAPASLPPVAADAVGKPAAASAAPATADAAGRDDRLAAMPEATGRSTATAGDPYGHLVPVQTMPRVHLIEPSLSGAFAAPDAAVDGKLATFERSALAVPRGFELRPPVVRSFTPWPAAVPSLAMVPPSSPVSIGGPIDAPAAVDASAKSPGDVAPAPTTVSGSADAAAAPQVERQAAAVPVAPVQTLTPAPADPAPPVLQPGDDGAAKAEPAVVPPIAPAAPDTPAAAATAPSAEAAPSLRATARETHHSTAGQAKHHSAVRIERVRRETARPVGRTKPAHRDAAERYDDLPELAPLPPGVVPPQP